MRRYDLHRFARPASRPLVLPAALLLMGFMGAAAARPYDDIWVGRDTTLSGRQTGGLTHIGWRSEKEYQESNENKMRRPHPTVNIIKGAAINEGVLIQEASTLNMSGGLVKGDIMSRDHSAVNISGGVITGIVDVSQYSTVTISGGTINGSRSATLHSDSISADLHSVLSLRGGHITTRVEIMDKATLHVYGTALKATRVSHGRTGVYYALSGTLADGTVLHTRLHVYDDTAHLVLHNAGSGS